MLDLAGPLQVFHEANRIEPRYDIRYCSTERSVTIDGGLTVAALEPLIDAGADDIVVVPGMPYRFTRRVDRSVHRWLARSAANGAAIASVCTGAFLLGDAGLLNDRRCRRKRAGATTN